MVAFTYDEFGAYIGSQSPYSQPGNATLPPGFNNPASGITTIQDDVNYFWDFRHAFPWDQEPGNPQRPLKLQNYQIIKTMLIPYSYNRFLDSTHGGSVTTGSVTTPFGASSTVAIEIHAHILVGYTSQVPVPEHQVPVPPPAAPPGTPYEELGLFIRDQTPFATTPPQLLADERDRYTLETGVSWLAHLSAFAASQGGPPVKSTSDSEMDLIQEQQCFNWDFELAVPTGVGATFGTTYGATAASPHPNPQYPPPPPPGPDWMRNFQISKAIRAVYRANVLIDPNDSSSGTQVVQGEILVGFSGGGGM